MSTEYQLVETEVSLIEICNQFKGSSWLAVDTEFEREKTYYPELCLVQVATPDRVAVIDPLALDNLQALFDLLYDSSITKVFHAARQDLEIFYHLQKAIPQPLFDTQIAAPLLGYNEQTGYANLVNLMLGVALSKAHTRTDWKRRPLQQAQLQYAADDVIYLGQVYSSLLRQLQQHGRLGWLAEDFAALSDANLYEPDPETVWKKNRGAKKLKGKQLSVMQQLAAWRERRARTENLPRNWLIRDEVIVDLAQLQPQSKSDLSRLKGLSERLIHRHGEEILKIVKTAAQQDPVPLTKSQSHKSLNTMEEAKVDALTALVRLIANDNHLHPNILASRKELGKFVRDESDSSLLKGWREHLVGKELKAFLDGKRTFQIIDNQMICKRI